jgi:hypothetical protein
MFPAGYSGRPNFESSTDFELSLHGTTRADYPGP